MRKFYLLLTIMLGYYSSYCQSPVFKIARSYFRSDPFQKEFSSFLNHLLNDPTLRDKIINKRTDTSLFYFHGTYSGHNPFFFKPKRMEIVLSESIIPSNDSVPSDTVYLYQLIGCNEATKGGVNELKKEFEKIHKRYKGGFFKAGFMEDTASGAVDGATYNYFDPMHAVAPFALTWRQPDDINEIYLVLTIRISVKDNRAILPVPFYAL